MNPANTPTVVFSKFGIFEVVAPELIEIVQPGAVAAVSGGSNVGCISVGELDVTCHLICPEDDGEGNVGCFQAGCGNNVGC